MDADRFNELMDELVGGLPVTLVVTRLTLLVKVLVETDGEFVSGETVFEDFVKQQKEG